MTYSVFVGFSHHHHLLVLHNICCSHEFNEHEINQKNLMMWLCVLLGLHAVNDYASMGEAYSSHSVFACVCMCVPCMCAMCVKRLHVTYICLVQVYSLSVTVSFVHL